MWCFQSSSVSGVLLRAAPARLWTVKMSRDMPWKYVKYFFLQVYLLHVSWKQLNANMGKYEWGRDFLLKQIWIFFFMKVMKHVRVKQLNQKKSRLVQYTTYAVFYRRDESCLSWWMVSVRGETRWWPPSTVLLRTAEWCLVMLRTRVCVCRAQADESVVAEVFENVNTTSLRPSSQLRYFRGPEKGSEWVSVVALTKHWTRVCSSFRSLCSIILNLNSLDQQITSKGVLHRF